MNANLLGSKAMLLELVFVWTIVKAAFKTLFVWPCLVFGLVVVVASGFSFKTIPQQFYQYVADSAHYPAAPEGYVNVMSCVNPADADTSKAPIPTVCKQSEVKPVPISAAAKDIAKMIEIAYIFIVMVTLLLNVLFGGYRQLTEAARRWYSGTKAA